MIEIIILISGVTAAYCIGNVMGWTSGRAHGHEEKSKYEKAVKELVFTPRNTYNDAYNMSRSKRALIDDISRNSLVWSEKDQTFVKVYDAEIIEFPGESQR